MKMNRMREEQSWKGAEEEKKVWRGKRNCGLQEWEKY
jgi:hypothetical protein